MSFFPVGPTKLDGLCWGEQKREQRSPKCGNTWVFLKIGFPNKVAFLWFPFQASPKGVPSHEKPHPRTTRPSPPRPGQLAEAGELLRRLRTETPQIRAQDRATDGSVGSSDRWFRAAGWSAVALRRGDIPTTPKRWGSFLWTGVTILTVSGVMKGRNRGCFLHSITLGVTLKKGKQ